MQTRVTYTAKIAVVHTVGLWGRRQQPILAKKHGPTLKYCCIYAGTSNILSQMVLCFGQITSVYMADEQPRPAEAAGNTSRASASLSPSSGCRPIDLACFVAQESQTRSGRVDIHPARGNRRLAWSLGAGRLMAFFPQHFNILKIAQSCYQASQSLGMLSFESAIMCTLNMEGLQATSARTAPDPCFEPF